MLSFNLGELIVGNKFCKCLKPSPDLFIPSNMEITFRSHRESNHLVHTDLTNDAFSLLVYSHHRVSNLQTLNKWCLRNLHQHWEH